MIDEAEARRLALMPKRATSALVWEPRQNHSGHLFAFSQVEDQSGAVIPGLTIYLEVRSPVVATACLYLFTLFKLVDGKRRRAYQLEVAPVEKRTHNGSDGPLYGPHEHFGEPVALQVQGPGVRCGEWSACFEFFAARCSLTADPVRAPC